MSSNTNDDSIADTDTSTVLYSQEPFETYQEKVVLLIQSLFPLHPASGISVTRARGGSFNRIIAVSLKHYILRVPRYEDQMDHADHTLLLKLLRQSPYILMRRLEGENLVLVLPRLDHRQRLSMARTIARLIAKYIHLMFPLVSLAVGRFLDCNNVDVADTSYIPPRTMHDFFTSRFTELSDKAAEQSSNFLMTYYDDLLSVTSGTNVLYHPDFAPRNILVRQNEATQDWEVSGLLDWDGCQVAPAEIAYLCPGWLWASPDEPTELLDDEMDWDPDRPVFDDKYSVIEELLPGFMDVVRSTRERSLKKVWSLAKAGIVSDEHLKWAHGLITLY
ncbi:hypothetical protein BDZ97DRAFT_1817974 [Flammula alnicola]|nr:hypothetical protein BDZ97DRAFT_1817974 [Flammula alnicola]